MVIRKKGSVFFIDGKEFTIGGGVFANDESEYMGLYGTVTEIRTDEDRDTENDTPDIYCEFMSPDSVAMAAELETRFSDLYRQDMPMVTARNIRPAVYPTKLFISRSTTRSRQSG